MIRPGQPTEEIPDGPLVDRARGGDLDAFSELVRRYQRPLMAKAIGSTRNVADADDMVQETLMRAWKELTRFRESEKFGAWLHRILGNLLADRGRRTGRELLGTENGEAERTDGAPSPEEALLGSELRQSLETALGVLPNGRQREVFRLRYVDGLAIQEIATRLGVHTGTIKVHLHRTSQKLRRILGDMETAP